MAGAQDETGAGERPRPTLQAQQKGRTVRAQGTAPTAGAGGAPAGGARATPRDPEGMDRWTAARGRGRQTVRGVGSLVWGTTCPEPLRGAAWSAPGQQQGRTASTDTCTEGSAPARTPTTVRGLTTSDRRGDTIATGVDQEEVEDEARGPCSQQGLMAGAAGPPARRAPTEWIKVPSHTGLHGNEMADKLADQGVRLPGVRLQGQEQPTLKRPAGWPRDRGDQEQGSQGLAPPVAAPQGVPLAAACRRRGTAADVHYLRKHRGPAAR